MKFPTTGFFAALAVLGVLSAVSSCSRSEKLVGSWQAAPERIAHMADASDVSSTLTFSFGPTDKRRGGTVEVSAVIEVQQPVFGQTGADVDYAANVSATASMSGTYAYSDDDDDDIILSFDPSTLRVNVDRDGVMYAQNVISGMQQPQLDSLTAATAERWRLELTPAVREQIHRYTAIDDIKIHHGDMMSCEIDDHDITMRRLGTIQ